MAGKQLVVAAESRASLQMGSDAAGVVSWCGEWNQTCLGIQMVVSVGAFGVFNVGVVSLTGESLGDALTLTTLLFALTTLQW